MSNPMLTPHDKWQSMKCDCVYQHGLQIHGKHEAMCDIPIGYLTGHKPPNHPLPATRYTVELVHRSFDGELQWFLMHRKGYVLYPVGDYPEYPLYI